MEDRHPLFSDGGHPGRGSYVNDKLGLSAESGWTPNLQEIRPALTLQHDQFNPALHFCRDLVAMIETSADRRDVRRPQSNSRSNEIIIAKDAVRRVEPDPAGAGQKNFRPRMQRTFGAA